MITQDCLQATAQLSNMPYLTSLLLSKSSTVPVESMARRDIEGAKDDAQSEATKLMQLLLSLQLYCSAHPDLQSEDIVARGYDIILFKCDPIARGLQTHCIAKL